MFKPSRILIGLACIAAAAWGREANAAVVGTIYAPGVQTSSVSNITTETFDGFSAGTYTSLTSSLGNFTSPGMEICAANQYGGAGGAGNYFAVGAESGQLTATLALNSDQNYFGFWYSAGDALNQIQLYENSTLEYTLDTTGLISFVNQQSDSSAYYGNPNTAFSGQDSGEPFAYVNVFGTSGTVFNTIVFNNTSTATGFEADNFSIAQNAQVGGLQFTPEPGALPLAITGCLAGAYSLRRRRSAATTPRLQGRR